MLPQQRETSEPLSDQAPLPGIRELFPELKSWAVSSPPLSSDVSARLSSLTGSMTSPDFFSPLSQTRQDAIEPRISSGNRSRSQTQPNSPYLATVQDPLRAPYLLNSPMAPPSLQTEIPRSISPMTHVALQQRLGSQITRPKSSPVSPAEEFSQSWDSRARHAERHHPRRHSFAHSLPHHRLPYHDRRSPRPPVPPLPEKVISVPSPRSRADSNASETSPHISSRVPPARYKCSYCPKRFSRPSSLRIHENSHTGAKPFVCPEPGCGRQFSVMSNMRRHQKTHRPKSAGGDSDSSGGDEGKEANTPPSVHEEYAGHSSFARKHHLNNRGHRTSNSMSPQAIRRDLARHSPRHGGYPNDDDDLEQHHSRRPFTSPN